MGGPRTVVTGVIALALSSAAYAQPAPAPQPPPQQPQQQPPPPQPYPQQYPYPQQPYPYPYYPPQQPYTPPPPPELPQRNHFHDGEVITDFAVVGTLAAIDIVARNDLGNNGATTLILFGGVIGGGATGYLIADKWGVDAGTARATTLGLLLGASNAALLVEPTGYERTSSVMSLLVAGSALGATGGYAYGRATNLTGGQATFIANMSMLGTATAALGAISGSRDGQFGDWETGTLAIGMNGGAIAGGAIAPHLDWSAHRANIVFATTGLGAILGGMASGLLTKRNTDGSTDANGDVVAASMTAGLWAGFGLGIMMTKDSAPDPRFSRPDKAPATASRSSLVPWVSANGTLGLMTGGTF
jgi:hypothetical protein